MFWTRSPLAPTASPRIRSLLDMGAPVRIIDVAEQLIAQSGRDIEIEFTGLRPGEKLHEDLFGHAEPRDVRPRHPLVSHVPVSPIDVAEVEELPVSGAVFELKRMLAAAREDGVGSRRR